MRCFNDFVSGQQDNTIWKKKDIQYSQILQYNTARKYCIWYKLPIKLSIIIES